MCVYCNVGDSWFRHDPPWRRDEYPQHPPIVPAPAPGIGVHPWSVEKLRDYLDLLKKIKAMEDQIGCPCEPNKADYIGLLEKRIEALEKNKGGA